ncbi:MAG: type II secretion system F family protein [Anaerolineae bacterium]|jgi:type IV pilus assembly protein PilC
MSYRYVAFDRSGQRVEGQIEVPSEAAAEEVLWEQGLTVAQLTPARPRQTLATLFPTFFGVKRRDLIIFSRQLATLLTSGVNILRALQLLAQQADRRAMREVLEEVVSSLERGQAFSGALAQHPLAFPDLYARTISVGERTGNLEDVLRQLATYLEKEQELVRKLRDALSYPIFVLMVAVGVVAMMLTVALPPMVDLFESFGADLPLPTRIMMAISRFASAYGLYVLVGGLILAALFAWWGGRPSGRRLRDATLLRVPVVGKIILQGQLTRFARTTSTLIRAGLPLSEVMDLVIQTIDNVIVAEALDRARSALLSGQGLSGPLAAERLFPSLLAQMVRVGEETGTLEENLETLVTFYEEEVDRNVQILTSMAEPALTIFVGAIVGFIAVSMVMPMYSILSEIK